MEFPFFDAGLCVCESESEREKMTRGKQKIEAQRKNAEKNQKSKGSQLEARAVALKVICPICKVCNFIHLILSFFLSILISIIRVSSQISNSDVVLYT